METIESFDTMGLAFLFGRNGLIQSSFVKERSATNVPVTSG
jgi:hypothetical protein